MKSHMATRTRPRLPSIGRVSVSSSPVEPLTSSSSLGSMTDSGHSERPVVQGSWVTSREAVLAFETFCTRRKWVFTETPKQTDFGKDGYLDLSHEGRLTGQCIAIQVKGRASLRRSGGYGIPADLRRRHLWMESTNPRVRSCVGPGRWQSLLGRLDDETESRRPRCGSSHSSIQPDWTHRMVLWTRPQPLGLFKIQ